MRCGRGDGNEPSWHRLRNRPQRVILSDHGKQAVHSHLTVSGQPADGFVCASFGACSEGMVCVNCDFFGDGINPLCAPHPDLDLEGFEALTDYCPAIDLWFECDGAEDCPVGEYCTLDRNDSSRSFHHGECHPTPVGCDEQTACTFCNDDADCPNGWACRPKDFQGLLSGRSGCVDESG